MAGRVIRRGAKWGGITGTLSAQTDLQSALNDKVDAWSSAKTYNMMDVVVFSGLAFISNQNNNTGHQPFDAEDPGWWTLITLYSIPRGTAGQVFTNAGDGTGEWADLPAASTKTGSATFTTGTTHTVTDAWITASTFVTVSPTGTKAGSWTVDSAAGSFTITSTASESGVTFDWGAMK